MPNIFERPEFFLVWKEGSESHTPTYKHSSYEKALEESIRLTRKHGGKFYVLAHTATVEKDDIKISELNRIDDDIPF